MKAMILAAGLGTRLKPLTDSLPKALVPINGKPVLEYTIRKLIDAGVRDIIVNVHHYPDQIIDFIGHKRNFGINIEISDEREDLLDTGGGIKKAAHFFNDGKPFFVHNVDILSNVDLIKLYNRHLQDKTRLASLVVSYRETNRYLLFDDEEYLRGWINIKTGETKPRSEMDISPFRKLAYAGIQVISPAIFERMAKEQDSFSIIDFYLRRCGEEKIAGFLPENLKMLDIGKPRAMDNAGEFVASL